MKHVFVFCIACGVGVVAAVPTFLFRLRGSLGCSLGRVLFIGPRRNPKVQVPKYHTLQNCHLRIYDPKNEYTNVGFFGHVGEVV